MNKIDWQELSIEKSSILNIREARYIQSEDNYGYPFMLCMGKDKFGQMKLFLIECINNDYKVYLCKDEEECDNTAFKIIVYLINNGKVIDFLKQ